MSQRTTNLVVVRCGDKSLHPGWLAGAAARNWDLAVSYFGKDESATFPGAAFVHRYKGGKWDGVAAFFEAHPDLLQAYDYFWLPDDDIATDAATINEMFAIMRRERLELAQPGLSAESYFSHPITLANDLFEYRTTTFIEIMVPVLDQKLMRRVLPILMTTRSGFGLDLVWHRFTSAPDKVAVIDRTAVTHTRPVGGPLKQAIEATGTTREAERSTLLSTYGQVKYMPAALSGRLRSGRRVSGRRLVSLLSALGYARRPFGRRAVTAPISAYHFGRIVAFECVRALVRPINVTRIEPPLEPLKG